MASIPSPRRAHGSAPVGPSSLTQRGARPALTCPSCGSLRLTALGMTLTDGTPVQFASCHDCEHRQWVHEGRALELADVLARTTKPHPAKQSA